jgi:dipeptidase
MNTRRFSMMMVALLMPLIPVIACTNFLITKGASTDGSTMISYAADSHILYGELYHFPARDYPDGSFLDIYEWDTGKYLGKIKQVGHTYSVIGNMNEHQVSIGETTYGGREELSKFNSGIMDYGSLMWVTLQRARTAREAIKIIAELFNEYGYHSSGESFSIADPNEVWMMEMIGKGEGQKGALWVAMLIPDGYVSGHANQARITTFPFNKKNDWFNPKQTTFHSPDVITFAREKGWFKGNDKDFSFSDTYAPVDFGAARFCEIRVWSFFKDVNSSMQSYIGYASGRDIQHDSNGYAKNRMPLWIKPDKKISVHDVMNFMRDHLEGTELDMTKDYGAGPYGNPYRWRPLTFKVDGVAYCNERATATQQTGFSFVSQMRSWLPDPVGGIHWFSVDDASSTVYFPVYCGSLRTPESYKVGNGNMMEFSENAAFWVFNQVSNFAYTRYNHIHPEIYDKQQKLEKEYIAKVQEIDKSAADLYQVNPAAALELLTEFTCQTGDALMKEWKGFYHYLFTKYMDGNIKEPVPVPEGQFYTPAKVTHPGYSEDYYRRIVNDTGDKLKVHGSSH